MSRVHPDPDSFPPVPGTNVTSFNSAFLARKEQCGEHYFTLPSGRKLCYFKDVAHGVEEATTVLMIALHGGCEGKYKFLLKQPLSGVTLVSMDRPGYGGSTAAEPGYTFESAAEDILALARSLGHEQFILTGHSIGGFWCQQLAAKLPDHVRGIILWCPVADFGSPKMTQAHVKAAGRPPAVLHPTKGMFGCILRSSFTSYSKKGAVFDFKANLKDEMKHAPEGFSVYAQGGCERAPRRYKGHVSRLSLSRREGRGLGHQISRRGRLPERVLPACCRRDRKGIRPYLRCRAAGAVESEVCKGG